MIVFAIAAFAIFVSFSPAYSASTDGSNTGNEAENPDYASGKDAIKKKHWSKAIAYMKNVVASDENKAADAHNYLGYAYRNLGQYDNAMSHYKEALRLNPKHRGALEYMGEAYLKLDNPAAAKKLLTTLDDICTFGCPEYNDLKAAIEKYGKAKN